MNYKDVIESKYDRGAWQQLLHDIFLSKVTFYNRPSTVHVSSRLAKEAFNLGRISLSDGESIAIYEVELTDKVDIERNRRGIRDMLTSDWRNMGYAGAFMFCYRKEESILRFSYVSETWGFNKQGVYEKISTDTKRYTYLLGEGRGCRTAIEQFGVLKNSKQSLSDVTAAFSVEALTKQFYKDLFEWFLWAVDDNSNVTFPNNPTIEDDDRDDIEKKIIRMITRIMFVWFIKQKDLVPDRIFNVDYLSTILKDFDPYSKTDGIYYNAILQNLFFGTLNRAIVEEDGSTRRFATSSKRDIKTLYRYAELFSISEQEVINLFSEVPFLNGGLFERDATDETAFPLPAKYMQSLLDFFASYNFTIDENDPDDAEVGVDPEMLGRIFENLLEDNKDKGAFYTPKEIVSYMCRESLIAYLQTDIEDEATKEAIRQFVTTHDVNALGTNDKFRQQVDEALKNVKICDPAIGSGAFPMGLLKELFQCRTAIEGIAQSKAAEIKKHIIQQNIYGVDIERGAVDIARLRFWLSLIVDEETPQALPNLDFKIMQGNSLLEQYKGVDLSTMTEKKADESGMLSIFDSMLDVYRLDLRKKLDEYYSCTDHKRKAILKQDIIINVKQQLKEQSINVDFGSLDLSGNNQFMLWHTWFYDVFSQGGFDIVIGNPPYIGEKGHMDLFRKTRQDSKMNEYYLGKMDYFYFFFHLAINMLSEGGQCSFITTNYYPTADGAKNLRLDFKKRTSLRILLHLGNLRLFDGAPGQHRKELTTNIHV